MNWLNRDLPPKTLEKLDAKIKLFMSEQTELDGAEGSLEVKILCIDLYKVYKDKDDQRTEEELLAMGERWDTDEPELAHIQKYINRLMSDRLQEASDYFEEAAEHEASKKSEAASDAISKMDFPAFARHQIALKCNSMRGVYERQTIYRRI
jgi:hypothetical protein